MATVKTSPKPKRGYHFDPSYGTWVKFPKRAKAKRTKKQAAKAGAETRRRKKYNREFDYGNVPTKAAQETRNLANKIARIFLNIGRK